MTWAERAAERSPTVQRTRERSVGQAQAIVAAARRLIAAKGPAFTTQDLIKESGIALQTFYRYFPAKDALFLAVIEDVIDESCAAFRAEVAALSDPIERLRFYVTATVRSLDASGSRPTFMTSEHFRLQTIYPKEVARATQPFTDLLVAEIDDALALGRIHPQDAKYSAWLITQLTMSVFHHYDCAGLDEPVDGVADRLWTFCLAALSDAAPAVGRSRQKSSATHRPTAAGSDDPGND